MASSFWNARLLPLWLNTPADSASAVRDKSRPQPRSTGGAGPAADSPFIIEAFGFETAADITREWAELIARSLEPNVFMEPGFALAAAQHLARADRPTFIAVWDRQSAGERRLRAYGRWRWRTAPARLMGAGSVAPFVWRAGCHALVPSAIGPRPAAARRATRERNDWRGFHVACRHLSPAPYRRVSETRALWPDLRSHLAHALDRGLEWRLLDQHERAAFVANGAGVNLSKQTYQGTKRRRRQLERHGSLVVSSARDPADIRNATEAFLALEESGWKGRRRTALLCDSSRAAFARTMTRRLAREGKCRIDALTLDGRPIAMGIMLKSRARAFFWKIAYDETFAEQSPGLQLALETTRIQQSEDAAQVTDSCTVPGNTMIERLWRDRLPIVDLALPLYPGANEMLGGFARRERIRRRLTTWAGRSLRIWRGTRPRTQRRRR